MFALFVLHVKFGLFRLQCCSLRSDFKSSAAVHAGKDRRAVVRHVSGCILDLKGKTCSSRVSSKNLIRDLDSCTAGHAQAGNTALIGLPSIRRAIEAGKNCTDLVLSNIGNPCPRIFLIVASALRGQEEHKVFRLCFRMDIRFGDLDIEGFGRFMALDLNYQRTGLCCPVGIGLFRSVNRLSRKQLTVCIDFDFGRRGYRIVNRERNSDGRILRLCSLIVRTRDDDFITHRFQAGEFIVQLIGAHRLTIDLCLKVNPDRVAAVCLCRDCIGHLSAGYGGLLSADFRTIQDEMHGLLNRTNRSIRERNSAGIRCGHVECGAERQLHDRDTVIDPLVLTLNICHTNLDTVHACSHVRSQVNLHSALCNIHSGLYHVIDGHTDNAVTRRNTFHCGGPYKGNRAFRICGNRFGKPSGHIVHCYCRFYSLVGTSATAAGSADTGHSEQFVSVLIDEHAFLIFHVSVSNETCLIKLQFGDLLLQVFKTVGYFRCLVQSIAGLLGCFCCHFICIGYQGCDSRRFTVHLFRDFCPFLSSLCSDFLRLCLHRGCRLSSRLRPFGQFFHRSLRILILLTCIDDFLRVIHDIDKLSDNRCGCNGILIHRGLFNIDDKVCRIQFLPVPAEGNFKDRFACCRCDLLVSRYGNHGSADGYFRRIGISIRLCSSHQGCSATEDREIPVSGKQVDLQVEIFVILIHPD